MPITFRPLGGLGNQLFTYAAGRSLADKLQTTLHADIVKLGDQKKRSFQLQSFGSRIDEVSRSAALDERATSLASRLLPRVPHARPRKNDHQTVITERGFWFDPRITGAPDGVTIDGYLQSWKYFETSSTSLRTEIASVSSPSSWYLSNAKSLTNLGDWIGIHVRRGDYLEVERMGLTSDSYYERAVSLLRAISSCRSYVVFSDSPDLAKQIAPLRRLRNCLYLETPKQSPPIETLNLMAQSSHLIISNSSFSWWAAWLGETAHRRVIYPNPWIDFRFINTRDLFMPNWIGLGRDDFDKAAENHVGY